MSYVDLWAPKIPVPKTQVLGKVLKLNIYILGSSFYFMKIAIDFTVTDFMQFKKSIYTQRNCTLKSPQI